MDASEAPKVLVFQIGAVAVFVDLDGYLVLTFLDVAGNIELRRLHRALTIANPLTVDPDVERRHDTLEAQEGLTLLPTGWQAERTAVLACGVALYVGGPLLLRLARDIRRVNLEGIAGRDVDRCAVGVPACVLLPVGWYGKCSPAAGIEVRAVEVAGALFRCLGPAELPCSVQTHHAVALLLGVWDEVGTGWFTMDLQHVVVLPVVVLHA